MKSSGDGASLNGSPKKLHTALSLNSYQNDTAIYSGVHTLDNTLTFDIKFKKVIGPDGPKSWCASISLDNMYSDTIKDGLERIVERLNKVIETIEKSNFDTKDILHLNGQN